MKICIFEKEDIHPKAINLLTSHGFQLVTPETDVQEVIALLVRTYTQINKTLLKKYPNVKYILRAGVGLDTIDSSYCKQKGILVFNSPGSNANAVAELVICMTLMLLRNIVPQHQELVHGRWRNRKYLGEELARKIIGLIGCGAIGQRVAKKLASFQVLKIFGFDPFLDAEKLKSFGIIKVDLDTLLKESDIISLHLPLLPETKHLISAKELARMKPTSFLINTSRGGIINENDLILALKKHTLRGAALDVFENEPDIKQEFLSLQNCIITPHIGAFTKEAHEAMSVVVIEQFLKYLKKIT